MVLGLTLLWLVATGRGERIVKAVNALGGAYDGPNE